MVDNTGIDSLAALFETLFIRADYDPFGTESRIIQNFPLDEEQLKDALSVAIPAETDAEKALVPLFYFRFSCNHVQDTQADVMTGFALGPDDKATIMAMFLSEVYKWDEWQSNSHNAYSIIQSYFARTSPGKLTKEIAEHLAFHLIDRTQTELRILENRSQDGEKLSDDEQTRSLQRIVTLLLGLRSVATIPMVGDKKSQMWVDLARITDYLKESQLASASYGAAASPNVARAGAKVEPPVQPTTPPPKFQLKTTARFVVGNCTRNFC